MTAEVCCVMPCWSQSTAMNWDSNYAYLRRVLPQLSMAMPDWLWIVAWPQRSKGADTWRWHDDGLFTDRIVPFPWPYSTQMRASVSAWDTDRFQQLDALGPTVYWLLQVESGINAYGGYQSSFNVSSRPAIVAQHLYVIHKSLPYPDWGLLTRLWLQMGGSLASDRVIMSSHHANRMMHETFSEFLSPTKLAELESKTTVIPFGLVDDYLAGLAITPRPNQPPVIVYNHRFEAYKQHRVTGDVLRELRSDGKSFEVWCTQSEGQKLTSFPVDQLVGHPDQHVYLQNIAVPAINTLNSVHETFCISALDSIALGQLLVAPNAVTFPELVPPHYPWLFESANQQKAMLAHIIDTWPAEYNVWHQKLRDHARATFGLESYAKAYATVLSDTANQWFINTVPKDHTRANIDTYAQTLPTGRYALDELATRFRRAIKVSDQGMTNRRVVREFCSRGAKLTYDPVHRQTTIVWSSPMRAAA